MKSRITKLFCCILPLLVTADVLAYGLVTHSRMTERVFQGSKLEGDSSLLADLDLLDFAYDFGRYYYELDVTAPKSEQVKKRERRRDVEAIIYSVVGRFSQPVNGLPPSLSRYGFDNEIKAWLMSGSIAENRPVTRFSDFSVLLRALNRFYDPVNDKPFNGYGIGETTNTAIKAPNWALGTRNDDWRPGTSYLKFFPDHSNRFTLWHAKASMYRALTGMDFSGNRNIGPGASEETELIRKTYWATTFRSLGHILHVLEDMGQPENTRNDYHGPELRLRAGAPLIPYTVLTEQRAIGAPVACLGRPTFLQVEKKVFPDIKLPGPVRPYRYDYFSDYFSTAVNGDVQSGLGLADYSNRNFLTDGTNLFSNNNYIYPPKDLSAYEVRETSVEDPCLQFPGFAEDLWWVDSDVKNMPHTTKGSWFDIKTKINIKRKKEGGTELGPELSPINHDFVITENTLVGTADDLLPRAVDYAAGFLDLFFRPRVGLIKEAGTIGQFRIRNYTDKALHGTFELFYDAVDGRRLPVPNTKLDNLKIPHADPNFPDQNRSDIITVSRPTSPLPLVQDEYVLVFRGDVVENSDTNKRYDINAVTGKYTCHPKDVIGTSEGTVVVKCDGTVWAWGVFASEAYWGTIPFKSQIHNLGAAPVEIKGFEINGVRQSVKRLFRGHGSSIFAITENGDLFAWGPNNLAQLGLGDLIDPDVATLIPRERFGGRKIIDIAAKGGTTVALDDSGVVWTWGMRMDEGLFGEPNPNIEVENGWTLDSVLESKVPVKLPTRFLGSANFGSISAVRLGGDGGGSLVLLDSNGHVWGRSYLIDQAGYVDDVDKLLILPKAPPLKTVSASSFIAAGLDDQGVIWTWGNGNFGALGKGQVKHDDWQDGPFSVPSFGDPNIPVKDVRVGSLHVVALKDDGTVWTWGNRFFGQVYTGTWPADDCSAGNVNPCGTAEPVQVDLPRRVVSIAAGAGHSIAVTEEGSIWTWGLNHAGQLGQNTVNLLRPYGSPKPARVLPLKPLTTQKRVLADENFLDNVCLMCRPDFFFL